MAAVAERYPWVKPWVDRAVRAFPRAEPQILEFARSLRPGAGVEKVDEEAVLEEVLEEFPRLKPLLDRAGCDMSFSGLKTALRRARDLIVDEKGGLTPQDRGADVTRRAGSARG